MTPKILIRTDGPYYYEEPDMPKTYGGNVGKTIKEWQGTLTKAKDKAIKFDSPEYVLLTLWENNEIRFSYDGWKEDRLKIGDTFLLPSGYRVEVKTNHPYEECNIECICTYEDDYFATLLPEQETKPPLFFIEKLCDMHQRPACEPNERVDCKCEWVAFERQKVVAPSEEVKLKRRDEDEFYKFLLMEIIDFERLRDSAKKNGLHQDENSYELAVILLKKVKGVYVTMKF